MATITVKKEKIERQGGVVILPVKEYQKLLERTAPVYQLSGEPAARLDKLVEQGIREHKQGKTKVIRSLADLD